VPPLLLVEDNASTREAVKVVLEAEGYPVVAAAAHAEVGRMADDLGAATLPKPIDIQAPRDVAASYRCPQTQPEPVAGRKANAARPRHGRRPVLTSPSRARLSKRR
jgi:hypothetical protein